MRLLLLAVFAMVFAAPCLAQVPGYLNDQSMFQRGWTELIGKVGSNADVAEIAIRPEAIEILARASAGGARIDRWRVGKSTILGMTFHRVAGPQPERPSSPVTNVESGFFALSSLPLDRFWPILEAAKARVRLDDPGSVTSVRIARSVTILPTPAHGEVRWSIGVGSGRESASVTAAIDGRIMGVDISGTVRGRNRNFHEQDEWPLADAQASFRSIVGARAEVFGIDVSRTAVTMRAVSAGNSAATTGWIWDGGTFRKDFLDMPNMDLARRNGNLPFTLDEIDLSKLPSILKAARAQEPTGHPRIMIVRAAKERTAVGAPRVLWEVQMVDSRRQIPLIGEDFSERTVVKLMPDGAVESVLLPKSLRPKVDRLSPVAILAALETLRSSFGADPRLFEMSFGSERATVSMISPTDPGMTFEVELTHKLEEASPRPLAMLGRRSTFSFADLSQLDEATLDSMLAKAREAVPLPGSRVHRIRIWNGEPFWRPKPGLPYLDIRVGVPPRNDAGGYVVFAADGKHVETVR